MKTGISWRRLLTVGCVAMGSILGGTAVEASNVQVALEGELLVVNGDNLANRITIATVASGDVVVTGRLGTTINGLPSLRLRRPTINSVEIQMNAGDDDVVVNGMQIANDLYANLGDGNDAFRSGANATAIGANLSVEGGAGNETIRLSGWTIGGDSYIDGQTGTLTCQLSDLAVSFILNVIGDDFRDLVSVANSTIGDFVAIETKGGNDSVTLNGSSALGAMISTDMGADAISITDVTVLEDIGVFSGTDNDRVELFGVAAAKNITVSLDAGNDYLSGTAVTAGLDAVFEGGFGTDTYADGGIVGGVKTEVKEFEIFP